MDSGMVYEDAEQLYAEVQKDGHRLLEEAFGVLFPRSAQLSQDLRLQQSRSGSLFAFNTTFFPRMDVVKVPVPGAASLVKPKAVQLSKEGNVGYALMDCSKDGNSVALMSELNTLPMPVSGSNPIHDLAAGN
jgi:alpha-mannosidase